MKKVMKVLIIDDERYSRDELKHLLNQFENIEVVGEAETGEKGLLAALKLQPDVAFVDIEMPKMNGIEVAKSLLELKKVPLLVFATAFPNFAADAFRLEAIDYLLKPFDEEQLREAVDRLEKRLMPKETPATASSGKLAIERTEEIAYLQPQDILYLYREDKVTRIVEINNEYETRTSLKELEARLKDFSFFRIHKSYLVNLDYVTRLVPWFNGAFQLELKGRKEMLSVSRNYAKELREKIEL
jgi:two-component system, LytTR family, response regulator LytT